MTTFKTRGLVLKEYEKGEADKSLMLLCKGYGRIMVYARGARKVKSKFLAASQILTYGDYVIADGKNFYSMCQCEVIEGFYPIRQDYNKLCQAGRILEICEKTIPVGTPCDELLLLVLKTLQWINADHQAGPDHTLAPVCHHAVSVFLFRFILFHGLEPIMDKCCVCGGELESSGSHTLFCDEGMICLCCEKNEVSYVSVSGKARMPLSLPAQKAVLHILASNLNRSFLFKATDTVYAELAKAAELCFRCHFSIILRSDI